MGQRGLVDIRIVAGHRILDRGEAGHDIARPIVAFQLNMAPATGQENTAMGGDRLGRRRLHWRNRGESR